MTAGGRPGSARQRPEQAGAAAQAPTRGCSRSWTGAAGRASTACSSSTSATRPRTAPSPSATSPASPRMRARQRACAPGPACAPRCCTCTQSPACQASTGASGVGAVLLSITSSGFQRLCCVLQRVHGHFKSVVSQACTQNQTHQGMPSAAHLHAFLVKGESVKGAGGGPRSRRARARAAQAVVELQRRLPMARVMYVSATGATDANNLCYMRRLGLWGAHTAFKDKGEFVHMLTKRGVSAMELVRASAFTLHALMSCPAHRMLSALRCMLRTACLAHRMGSPPPCYISRRAGQEPVLAARADLRCT